MSFARPDHFDDLDTLYQMPGWIASVRAETFKDVAFLSDLALSHLHLVLGRANRSVD